MTTIAVRNEQGGVNPQTTGYAGSGALASSSQIPPQRDQTASPTALAYASDYDYDQPAQSSVPRSSEDPLQTLGDRFNAISIQEPPSYDYQQPVQPTERFVRSPDPYYGNTGQDPYYRDGSANAQRSYTAYQNGQYHAPPIASSSSAPPPQAGYDPLLQAASDVLGGPAHVPPPRPSFSYDNYPQLNQAPGGTHRSSSLPAGDYVDYSQSYQQYGYDNYYASPTQASYQSSNSFEYNVNDGSAAAYGPYTEDPDGFRSSASSLLRPPSVAPSFATQNSDPSSSRPAIQRSSTSQSVTLGTQRSKAIDLTSPPYTREFIEQYRQRIKGDPDPEAHFKYAKYLIDAARHLVRESADQKNIRKFCEMLVQESLRVIRRLATQGETFPEAQFFLANCYGTGTLGLQVDHERAYHLYLQAAKQNHAGACYRVAFCNERGAGTRREFPRAFAFYRKAASLGDTAAMYKLGMVLLAGGLDQPKQPREAVAWLRRAAEQADVENPHALHELGLLHEVPNSQLVPYDPAYAKSLFTRAAQFGYTQSQYKLGQCYEYGTNTCPVDPKRSIAWYTKAAEKGNAEAELALSGWYLTGSDGVLKQSDSEAYLWARRAANKGLAKAEYAVGYYAEIGIGVKQDIEVAKKYYMRAAAQGNKRAMARLTELKRLGNRRGQAQARPTRQEAKEECVIC